MSAPEFSRSAILYGEAAQAKIEAATVVVCGVGAVGSFALEALARLGVGNFVLADSDTVDESNINRQLCALHSTVGKRKTDVMRARVLDINPRASVETFDKFIDASNAGEIAGKNPTVIVDAIDSIAPKVALCAEALRAEVPIVSSMGAARRTAPSAISVAEIFKTFNCPLAARMRKELRALGFTRGQKCVFSTEPVKESSHLASGSAESKKIIGSTPVITGIFGLRLAGLALDEIIADRKKFGE